MKDTGFTDRLWSRLLGLPRAALVAGAVAITALFATASIYAYRTYDYVQHDNDFCLSCHLMVDPFERFARSAHRDMGCKACHQPTIVTRSRMALTQIVENPDSLETHAEVPNERCAECHIDGDPEQWTLIASSAGHRVHLESDDPDLEGLQCVQCHSTSLHEFAAADETCGQSACHAGVEVQLGRMSNLAIHCAACHAFSRPLPDTAGVETMDAALQPTRSECFSCHAMRVLVEMPENDPHQGACAACHNPHDQRTPAEAVETCATSGCHSRPDTITAFHRGLAPGILENCTACHAAHDFHAPGTQCIDCHTDIDERGAGGRSMRSGGMRTRVPAPAPRHPAAASSGTPRSPYLHAARFTPAVDRPAATALRVAQQARAQQTAPRQDPQQASGRFRHAAHRGVACLDCHSTNETHGALTVVTPRDCQECHHSARNTSGPDGCTRCHLPGAFATGPITWPQTLRIANGEPRTRALPFDHDVHAEQACTLCHTQPFSLDVGELECTTCHTEHHEVENDCTACHQTPPPDAHDAQSHLTCDGAGCHRQAPVDAAAQTRSLCLACHQDLSEHRPGETCADCHPIAPPAARPAGLTARFHP